jgi:hypothetical protein
MERLRLKIKGVDMKLMEDFQNAKQALYDHVGFKEDWVVYYIEDRTNMYWSVNKEEVKFAKTMEDFNSDDDYYQNSIYTQRFYNKWIYRGKDLTMIFVDTHTDGNRFFAFYDNEKEVKD